MSRKTPGNSTLERRLRVTEEGEERSHTSKVWSWLNKEFHKILPVWAFFFFAMALFSMTVSAVLGKYQVKLNQPHWYLVGSLIMAKAVLLIDHYVDKEWLRGRPLIYPTLWNTGLYFLAAVVFEHVERMSTIMRRQHVGFARAARETLNNIGEPRYWAATAWLIALIAVFCAFRELINSIGQDRFKEMFFGRSSLRKKPAGSRPAAA